MTATDDQLREYAKEHLVYDVQMMRGIQQLLRISALDEVLVYALLESFTIHCCLLIEFFYIKPNPKQLDDVWARHYCAVWSEGMPSVISELRVRERVGIEIAHASLARLDVKTDDKWWYHEQIRAALEKTLDKFVIQCRPELIDDDTRAALTPPDPITCRTNSAAEALRTRQLSGTVIPLSFRRLMGELDAHRIVTPKD